MILAQDKETLKQHTSLVIEKALSLGWIINREKSNLIPTQEFSYLGIDWNTSTNLVRPCQRRIDSLITAAEDLEREESTSPRLLQSLIGKMVSMADLLPYAKLMRRPLQFALREVWDNDPKTHDKLLRVTSQMREAILWWRSPQNRSIGTPILDTREKVSIFTDASLVGWGANWNDLVVSGRWTQPESEMMINALEMMAAERTLQHFLPSLTSSRVEIRSDNMTVVANINKQGGLKSPTMYRLTRRVLLWCKDKKITLEARHIPGKLNVVADRLSRPDRPLSTEWQLNTSVFQQLTQILWMPLTDLFATRWNHQVPHFISPFPDEKALATDALDLDWDKFQRPYLFPPVPVLRQCLEKKWPDRAWYPLLIDLLVDVPVQLPPLRTLLVQGLTKASRKYHPLPESMCLTAWPLSSQASYREAFLMRLQNQPLNHKENPHSRDITPCGTNTLVGWTDARTPIHTRPLYC